MTRDSSTTSASTGAWAYVGLVWALGVGLGVIGFHVAPLRPADTVPLVALLLLGILSRVLPDSRISLAGDAVRFSFFGIVILAAAVMIGPLGGAVVGVGATIVRPGPLISTRRLFNSGMFGVTGLVGGLAYHAVGGADPLAVAGAEQALVEIGIPLIVADLAQAATNALLLSGIVSVTAGVPFWVQARSLLSSTGPAYVAYGVVAFLLVVLWGPGNITWFSAVLTVVPLVVTWWVFSQFGAELEAHERTTSTLVAALDMRHPGAAAHAQRVAMLCGWIGESMRLSPRALEELRTAGLLHDVGLLGTRQGDIQEVIEHPVTGARMLDDISFAAPVLPAIAAHHERLDGSGYPHGMVEPEIPIGARIIAVADTFDALAMGTEEHSPLPVRLAIARLESEPGLDQTIVAALHQAAERHGFLDAPGQGWLGHSKFAERAALDADDGRRGIQATIAASLSQGALEPTWITRHDHPDHRWGQ